jgi:signal peptidase I
MKPWFRWSIWIALVLGVAYGVLKYWFIDFHLVPADPTDARNWSNSPNLEPGELALVWRAGEPHVGDMVRCPDPTDPQRWLVARVIGTGGDKIEFVDNQLRINGFRVSTAGCATSARKVADGNGLELDTTCFNEELGGSKHDVSFLPNTPLPNGEWKVETGKLFLLSDHRGAPYAHDSREAEVSQLAVADCTQRLVVRIMGKAGWQDSARRMTFLF